MLAIQIKDTVNNLAEYRKNKVRDSGCIPQTLVLSL